MRVTYPLFKFLKPEHVSSMLDRGEVRVGTLHEYRDSSLYGEKTLDLREGQRRIELRGPLERRMEALAGFGVSAWPGAFKLDGALTLTQEWPNCHVYCASGAFFTSTISQSVQDKKTACVAILDPEEFFRSFAHTALGAPQFAAKCEYGSRVLSLDGSQDFPDSPSASCCPALLKGQEYADQREVRAVWPPRSSPLAAVLSLPRITDSMIELDFTDLDADAVLRKEHRTVGVRIKRKAGADAFFSTKIPGEVFSLVCAEFDGDEYLAFVPESRGGVYDGQVVRDADWAAHFVGHQHLFAGVARASVARLEYFSTALVGGPVAPDGIDGASAKSESDPRVQSPP